MLSPTPLLLAPRSLPRLKVLHDEFIHAQTLDAADASSVIEDESEATVDLAAKFLAHAVLHIDNNSQSTEACIRLLLNVLKHFTSSCLATNDIHSLRTSYSIDTHRTVLSACHRTVAALENKGSSSIPRQLESALLDGAKSGKASIFALFGGQGTNEPSSLILGVGLTKDEVDSSYYTHGLDVISWLLGATNRPSVAYLTSAPFHYHSLGSPSSPSISSFAASPTSHLAKFVAVLPMPLATLRAFLSAVVISASETFNDFTETPRKALHWLFYCGLHGQQAFPPVTVEPSLVLDTLDGGEGTPSPVLSVAGLPLKDLEVHIKKTSSHLPANSQHSVSLYYGPRAFIVTGPARALHGIVTNLRKVRAPNGADQSKVSFMQRKPAFSVRFLVVGVPYHSPYLKSMTDAVMDEELDEWWEPSDSKVPVYNANV
ncbi:hypothetical protein AGABI2DRAFT_146869 [Agaricus bisporus var. bisporus H97]|uniref:hypothetical protein n=1 Tax=Agaricus bisporus var. bisporus (strain H97 / ATCC MYA-4626 / FGSC 10389) TaxID=936046 RepID=UPI00029F4F6A|nr:hypothetical protein AGABI2DRAFT_146869 [Agaricus bisporus var. bisporus H97]EKV42027.1 hypothetical protein AGABI2DRAFT_146869 [Agaricus bisporus var. bisporus H97]